MTSPLQPSAEELAQRATLLCLKSTAEPWPTVNPKFLMELAAKLLEQSREIDAKTRAINYTLRQATMGHKSMHKLKLAMNWRTDHGMPHKEPK